MTLDDGKRGCLVPECANPHRARGYCRSHHAAARARGQIQRVQADHGGYRTRLYRIWHGMKLRCYTQTEPAYPSYGGRGITMDESWRDSFAAFRLWAEANGYQDDLQIDRIDNDAGYSPLNCRWVTGKANCRNRRNTRMLDINGEAISLADAAEKYGIPYGRLKTRLRKGWDPIRAVTAPYSSRWGSHGA